MAPESGARFRDNAMRGRNCLSDDVGQKDIFELDDPVLERQLALLEALDEHPVGHMRLAQRMDGRVEIGVFLAFRRQFEPQLGFVFLGQRQHGA